MKLRALEPRGSTTSWPKRGKPDASREVLIVLDGPRFDVPQEPRRVDGVHGRGRARALGAAEASGAAVPAASAGRLRASSPGQRCPSIESVLAAPPGPWPRGRPHHREPPNARHTAGARTQQPGLATSPETLLQVWVIILGGVLVPGAKLLVWFAPETAPDVGEEAPLVVPSGAAIFGQSGSDRLPPRGFFGSLMAAFISSRTVGP
ncbi:hypothetical protein IscW_ISCW021160 [Ixodes scapularis]|uniref:Uncharacterized protein n=1 Tax=Ixodes scapularis TaxID=6945 RepID=B7Q9Y9_IXOSC|nr:hypothetical protein IscW_ISCW021160 [Ixodes scapularis]|eukprot:XP_002406471.1 hypothetical protein IscW_ISCW021160 [Ixodes scapularis]